MDQYFNKILLKMGFKQQIETLFSLEMEDKLYATSNKWEVFAYYEDGKYYFSDNGDLVETFDAPDIDILFVLEEIKTEIKKYGCYLNVSKITKEINLDNLENEFQDYVSAVRCVDQMYKNL